MTDRELREIKRRFRPDKSNVSRIVGCFINENKQVSYKINQSLALANITVSEKLLQILGKALSGSVGISQHDISFSTSQVSEGKEHALLMKLRSSALSDEEALDRFYSTVANSLELGSNYAVLLAYDVYDVFNGRSDGDAGESDRQFSYIACAVCPIKEAADSLRFKEADRLFHSENAGGILSNPELGFMFPAFDDRQTNIYGALYYTRSKSTAYPEFTAGVFGASHPMPPVIQKAAFSSSLCTSLSDDCTLDVVKAMHQTVGEMVEAHKQSRDPEPLTISKHTVTTMLESIGVSEEGIAKMGEAMDEAFGKGAALTPKNLLSYNRFEVKMPEVKITVSPEYRDLITTRTVGDEKYLRIKISGPVEINGIEISTED